MTNFLYICKVNDIYKLIQQVSVVPNLRLWTILLWMTDYLKDNELKSNDRLKQEVKYT